MRTNQVKQKLARGEVSYGLWLTVGEFHTARALAGCGLDWLVVDMEHGPFDWSRAAALFAAIADAGCVPLTRIPCGSHDQIKRALDCGAWGIVIPMVDTVEQAQSAVAAAKYPPGGNRSLGGALHALSFGATADEYYANSDNEILVVVQTESPAGVEHADEIYSVPGVDVVFVGPRDLQAQMRPADGTAPDTNSLEAMHERIVDAAARAGIACGCISAKPSVARHRADQGFRMIGVGTDLGLALSQAQSVLEALRSG
ncbi:MAG: aldolase/citrate lyase family protein [Pirellulales bacterium]|nr:aldolase/citrate lyase family protein [Pirellulales bacterium]